MVSRCSNVEFGAGIVEGVGPEELSCRHGAFDLVDAGARAGRIGEVHAVVGEDGVDAVGYGLHQRAQEVAGDAPRRLLVELDEGELGHPVDRDEEVQLALGRADLRDVPHGVCEQTPVGRGMWKKPSA